MKLICKCENVEDLKTDEPNENFEFKHCGDGTALICKNCSEVVFIKFKNS
jgi:hypothetical protein